jgi:hypothetical protein
LCRSFSSKAKKERFGIPSKKGLKNGLEITVILTCGYWLTKVRKTGTVMATSPIAESLMTAICLIVVDNKLLFKNH